MKQFLRWDKNFSIGMIMLVVIIALALRVIRGDPEDLGVKPYGAENLSIENEQKDYDSGGLNTADLNLKDAVKSRTFWLFAAVMLICGSGDFMVPI